MITEKVSIIVPVYNVEDYLEQCLESLIKQTYRNIQIILIDDGSEDKSGEICDRYAKIDQRILVIHQENCGVSAARNRGLEKGTGKYIMFVDSDDWIEQDTLSDLLTQEQEKKFDVIMYGAYFHDIVGNKVRKTQILDKEYLNQEEISTILPELIKKESINALWNKIYQSDIINDYNIRFDESLTIAEDALFNYEVFLKVNTFKIIRKRYYHYMTRNIESLTKKYNPLKYEMLSKVNNKLKNSLKENSLFLYSIPAAKYIRVKNIYSCFLDLLDNNIGYKEKKAYINNIIQKENRDNWDCCGKMTYKLLIFILSTNNSNLIYIFLFLISCMRFMKKIG